MGNSSSQQQHQQQSHPIKEDHHAPEKPIPSIIAPPDFHSEFINKDEIEFLAGAVPGRQYQESWKMVYSSRKHGKSFNRFCHHLTGNGATLTTSFVFQLHPKKQVFRPTGYNDHYQYLNFGTQTMFNGIGMGGQMGFFAWGIDKDFETGQCRGEPNSTFGNPILASSQEWVLMIEQKNKTKSVLEEDDNAERVITGMLGHNFSHEEKTPPADDD